MVKKLQLDNFSNSIALNMGTKIIELAKNRNLRIAIQISRLNHIIFLFIDESLSSDKHNWIRRKENVARRFEESSLSVKNDLKSANMSLEGTFGLNPADYLAKGGSIPIFVHNAGMVGTVTVSGLTDIDDHNIILEALQYKDK